jgi:hypothetical protein
MVGYQLATKDNDVFLCGVPLLCFMWTLVGFSVSVFVLIVVIVGNLVVVFKCVSSNLPGWLVVIRCLF